MAAILTTAFAFPAPAMVPALKRPKPVPAAEIAEIRTKAESGDAVARSEMGDIYTDRRSLPPDYTDAARWYRLAGNGERASELDNFAAEHARLYRLAKSGSAEALYNFAQHVPHMATHLDGDAPREHWLILAASKGYTQAQSDIGHIYLYAYYGRRAKAEGADKGDYDAQFFWLDNPDDFSTGFEGESLETDMGNAIQWLSKAAGKGDSFTDRELGLAYAVPGPTQDIAKARQWLTTSSTSEACFLNLSGHFHDLPLRSDSPSDLVNLHVQPDYPTALACYTALNAKYEEGNNDWFLGYMFHHGLGTARDDLKAVRLLTRAYSTEYHPQAAYELSQIYLDSPVVPRDRAKAYDLLAETLAAYARSSQCMFIPQDASEMLFDAQSRTSLGDIQTQYLTLQRDLTPEERARVTSWLPGQPLPPPPPPPMPCV
jgi:TPR repeat protein